MLDVLMLFPSSAEAAAIDDFVTRFLPEIRQADGLHSLRVSKGDLMSRGGRPPYSRVIELSFESLDNWMGWVMAPQRFGKLEEFARVEPLIMFFETTEPA
jgi:hypothetical protein